MRKFFAALRRTLLNSFVEDACAFPKKITPESLCSPALLFVRELLNGAAGCVDEFDWGEI